VSFITLIIFTALVGLDVYEAYDLSIMFLAISLALFGPIFALPSTIFGINSSEILLDYYSRIGEDRKETVEKYAKRVVFYVLPISFIIFWVWTGRNWLQPLCFCITPWAFILWVRFRLKSIFEPEETEPEQADEEIVLELANVKVTNSKVNIGSQVYPMEDINSVSMVEQKPSNFMEWALIIVGIVVMLIPFLMLALLGETWLACFTSVPFGIALIVGSVYLITGKKPDYIVSIATESGKTKALGSEDQDAIQRIVDAINEALERD